ncbi:hypothetical protein [Streptomyces sp. NBC_00009]|uniref:hypothetical protein n=1 Tax=Streptomyces sp. NBC_00009 TaxID=2975620 RepID=UPI003244E826
MDASRVHANGGVFTQALGCKLSDKIAGIAPVIGSLPKAEQSTCDPSEPMPVLETAGTADPIMPFDGGSVKATANGHDRTCRGGHRPRSLGRRHPEAVAREERLHRHSGHEGAAPEEGRRHLGDGGDEFVRRRQPRRRCGGS